MLLLEILVLKSFLQHYMLVGDPTLNLATDGLVQRTFFYIVIPNLLMKLKAF